MITEKSNGNGFQQWGDQKKKPTEQEETRPEVWGQKSEKKVEKEAPRRGEKDKTLGRSGPLDKHHVRKTGSQ